MAESTPVLHYLDIGSLGRGEIIRLFLKDAGIEFKDIRYKYDDTWPATSKKLHEQGITRTGKVPVLEYKGLTLSQHIPILRFLARELNDYDGDSSVEKFTVDAVADLYIDWRAEWVTQLSSKTDKYKNETAPAFYKQVALFYAERSGPFLLGDKVTYADYAIYQSIDNNEKLGILPADLPTEILKFREAFEARPRVAAYIKERSQ